MQTLTEYHLYDLLGTQLGWFETWEEANTERLRLARELEIGTSIQRVEVDVPDSPEAADFREDIPGEDMGRWNAFLRAA